MNFSLYSWDLGILGMLEILGGVLLIMLSTRYGNR